MSDPCPEFSRIISTARIPPKGLEQQIEAKPAERTALAERFDLIALSSLRADLTVMPDDDDTIVVTGTIQAKLVQRCIVTLEPLSSALTLDIAVAFVPKDEKTSSKYASLAEDDLLDRDEEIEFFTNGKIDLGEMIAQQLGVNLDPYPRKEGAALTKTEFGPTHEKPHPFAKLRLASQSKDRKNKEKA